MSIKDDSDFVKSFVVGFNKWRESGESAKNISKITESGGKDSGAASSTATGSGINDLYSMLDSVRKSIW